MVSVPEIRTVSSRVFHKLGTAIEELGDINIDKEYGLIQQKKSNLSVRLRDTVILLYRAKQYKEGINNDE